MQKIIVCPNNEKLKILNYLNSNNKLHNIKFMTKNEYLNNYYFEVLDEAVYYLKNKYNYNIDICREYLNLLYIVDDNKKYKSDKLNFLQELKQELKDNNLLIINSNFTNYLKDKEIEVINYYDLDLYEERALNYKLEIPEVDLKNKVYSFKTIEDEVNFVCLEIIKLLNKGIDINKIYLANVSDEYLYIITKLFNYYHIPININYKHSIYSIKQVKDYLETNSISSEINEVNTKLIKVLNSLVNLDKDSTYNEILIDKLKHTYLDNKKLNNAINIKDLYKEEFTKDEYVFVLGFNQDILPKTYKDISYISDKEKIEVDMHDTNYLNNREKKVLIYILSNINNLYLSYKLESPFNSYIPSSLINELNLEVVDNYLDTYNYSNMYNKIRLGEKLDNYYLYGEKDSYLEELNTKYEINYNSYDNKYTGINNDLYLTNINYPLNLSYTSLNTYNECRFKYYINNVLKLSDYTPTLNQLIGSMYHYILSIYKNNNFDLELELNKYLEDKELSLKDKLLLVRMKKDLKELLNILKEQDNYTNYKEEYYEKKLEVPIDKKIAVNIIGYIDKIMFYKNVEDTYFSIIDYKTGTIDTHIEPVKYGLHMQLPVYLYLISYSKLFTSPIFTGIYYQNILFPYQTWSKKLENELKNSYKLNGYSTDNIEVLEKFDKTYEDSLLIRSMKYNDKGFSNNTKLIDNETLFDLIKYTKSYIDSNVDDIIDSKFDIDPKIYDKTNISCKYCKFKDICFMKDKDLKYLDKVEDLSFLGGDK